MGPHRKFGLKRLLVLGLLLTVVVVPADAVTNGIIAYPWKDATGAQQIFTINANGTGQRQITFGNHNGLPWWSPTGTQLAGTVLFYDPSCACNRLGIAVMNSDGSSWHPIAVDAVMPSWSSTGKIAFTANRDGTGGNIWVMNSDGSNQQQITTHAAGTDYTFAGWSPDGTRLVSVVSAPDATGAVHDQLWTMNADGSNQIQITFPGLTNLDCSGNPINAAYDATGRSWSINGTIVFWSGVRGTYGQVWVANSDGSNRNQLTCSSAPINNDDPMWAPDATQMTFSTNRNGPAEMWIMNADGSNQHRVTSLAVGPFPGNASWQPK